MYPLSLFFILVLSSVLSNATTWRVRRIDMRVFTEIHSFRIENIQIEKCLSLSLSLSNTAVSRARIYSIVDPHAETCLA